MFVGMARLHNTRSGSLGGTHHRAILEVWRLARTRSIEIDAETSGGNSPTSMGCGCRIFAHERRAGGALGCHRHQLIRDAGRLALGGAGFVGLADDHLLADASILTVITLRLIQRLSLLYGFETHGRGQRMNVESRRCSRRIDYGKDLPRNRFWKNWFPASWGASPPNSERRLRKSGQAA